MSETARSTVATSPVRLSVTVQAAPAHAFRVFTEDIGRWWPIQTHSINPEGVERAVMECRAGGRIVEIAKDGSEMRWGDILVWEPSARVVFSWNPSLQERPDTEVEVTFTSAGDGTTIVELEHRGWEQLGDEGISLRESYRQGWVPVLDRYRDEALGTDL